MPTTPFAVPTDITTRWVWTDATPPDADLLTVLISDSEVIIRSEFPDIDARIVEELGGGDQPPGAVTAGTVLLVVVGMVTRYLRNPDNVRTQGTGPFTSTYAGPRPGGLALSDEDRQKLDVRLSGKQAAFSVDTMPASTGHSYLGSQGDGFVVNGPDSW